MKKEYPDDRGALWSKATKNGENYLSGPFTCGHCKKQETINVWVNKYKKHDKQPDYRIKKSKDFSDQKRDQDLRMSQEQDVPTWT